MKQNVTGEKGEKRTARNVYETTTSTENKDGESETEGESLAARRWMGIKINLKMSIKGLIVIFFSQKAEKRLRALLSITSLPYLLRWQPPLFITRKILNVKLRAPQSQWWKISQTTKKTHKIYIYIYIGKAREREQAIGKKLRENKCHPSFREEKIIWTKWAFQKFSETLFRVSLAGIRAKMIWLVLPCNP